VIPESPDVIQGINIGKPIITFEGSDAREAYLDVVGRFLGDDIPMKFLGPKKAKGFLSALSGMFGGKS
jgi:septum site-determining protein MinD